MALGMFGRLGDIGGYASMRRLLSVDPGAFADYAREERKKRRKGGRMRRDIGSDADQTLLGSFGREQMGDSPVLRDLDEYALSGATTLEDDPVFRRRQNRFNRRIRGFL